MIEFTSGKIMAEISSATKRNFQKLHKNIESHKFTSRANKRDSRKNIIPSEYYTSKNNIKAVDIIVNEIKKYDCTSSFDTLILLLLLQKGIVEKTDGTFTSSFEFPAAFLDTLIINPSLLNITLPDDEKDPVGIIYQQYITEGEKNRKGSYYTPSYIVSELMDIKPDSTQTFCDPCCGTGSFLIEASSIFSPSNIYGYDIDSVAVKITKANLFVRFPEINFNKKIFHSDFLQNKSLHFDYFISNPPWGSFTAAESKPSLSCIKSNESFSYFLEAALKSICEKSTVTFLLPVSILNVKLHKDIRDFILNDFQIQKIKIYGKCFRSVLSDVISMTITPKKTEDYFFNVTDVTGRTFNCSIKHTLNHRNHNILLLDETDASIIEKIEHKGGINLSGADFALGIVTGRNSDLLKEKKESGFTPIITGKDIQRYYIKEPSKFIEYERKNFQQVCPDYFFRAEKKFVYRFISNRLVFAIDKNKYLALNSANIMLLPEQFPLNENCVLALLNSETMNFYFTRKINQIKILKDDLQNLPLPLFDSETQKNISACIEKINTGSVTVNEISDEIEKIISDYYGFSSEEIKRIRL